MNVRIAGFSVGLLAGLVGLTILEIHCPILDRLHKLTWHVGELAIATLAGAVSAPLLESAHASPKNVQFRSVV